MKVDRSLVTVLFLIVVAIVTEVLAGRAVGAPADSAPLAETPSLEVAPNEEPSSFGRHVDIDMTVVHPFCAHPRWELVRN